MARAEIACVQGTGEGYSFGSFECAGGEAFQQYCDCNLKYPVAHNGEGYFNALFGTIYYD